MGKLRLRLAAPLALVLFFLAPRRRERRSSDNTGRRNARALANGAAYRAAKERLVRKGRGFVRSYASRWIPAAS
jgi:hypothetical protein